MKLSAMDKQRFDFLCIEYRAVQDRLLNSGLALQKIETAFPVVLGAFYAWLWTNGPDDPVAYRALLCVPIALVALAFIRHWSERRFQQKTASYAELIEREILGAEDEASQQAMKKPSKGFEHHYAGANDWFETTGKHLGKAIGPFSYFAVAYWGLLLCGTVALAIIAPAINLNPPSESAQPAPSPSG